MVELLSSIKKTTKKKVISKKNKGQRHGAGGSLGVPLAEPASGGTVPCPQPAQRDTHIVSNREKTSKPLNKP